MSAGPPWHESARIAPKPSAENETADDCGRQHRRSQRKSDSTPKSSSNPPVVRGLQLVERNKARYALLVKAPKTHCRRLFHSGESNIKHSFPAGELSGRAEFVPFLVCTQALSGFRSDGWHADFDGRTFDIAAGAVLAEDVSKDYWIDTADEAPLVH